MPKYTPDLTTLTQVKLIQGITNTTDDDMLTFFIHAASEWIASQTNRVFVPYVDTKYYPRYGKHITSHRLDVDDDLLAVTTLTNGDATTIAASAYNLEPLNVDPKYRILLKRNAGVSWAVGDDPDRAISVAGVWGYHENYTRAWQSRTTISEALDASEPDISVASASGLEVLQYIKYDNEVGQITAISGTTLTVDRGVLGTTATTHTQDAVLSTYRYPPTVQYNCNRLVTFMYDNRDTGGRQVQIAGSVSVIEGLIPPEIIKFVESFNYLDFWTACDG